MFMYVSWMRIRVFWSDPVPVIEMRQDPYQIFKIWSKKKYQVKIIQNPGPDPGCFQKVWIQFYLEGQIRTRLFIFKGRIRFSRSPIYKKVVQKNLKNKRFKNPRKKGMKVYMRVVKRLKQILLLSTTRQLTPPRPKILLGFAIKHFDFFTQVI